MSDVSAMVLLSESQRDECVECLSGMIVVLENRWIRARAAGTPLDTYAASLSALRRLRSQLAPGAFPARLHLVREPA